ncbi:hypothetical protein GOODEAATRI_022032, partial [Goodea atripinnis]
ESGLAGSLLQSCVGSENDPCPHSQMYDEIPPERNKTIRDKKHGWGDGGSGGRGSSYNRWVAGLKPWSIFLSHCVLGQDTSPALPADGGQRARDCRLYGSPTSVSLYFSNSIQKVKLVYYIHS